jgi:hypothetical protein
MGDGTTALVAAIVGVAGTLMAPLFSQRMMARVQNEQFERQQQTSRELWLREQHQAELAQKRGCYVATNAANRRYRVELMKFLWRVNRGDVDDTAREELEAARHGHHAAFAEAQMIASTSVLRELDIVSKALSEGYRMTNCLEEGNPDPQGSFEEVGAHLIQLWDQMKVMRASMRRDLRIDDAETSPNPWLTEWGGPHEPGRKTTTVVLRAARKGRYRWTASAPDP